MSKYNRWMHMTCLVVAFAIRAGAQTTDVTNSNNGSSGYVPNYTGAATLSGTSPLYISGSYVGVGTPSPGATLDVNGNVNVPSGGTFNIGGVPTLAYSANDKSLAVGQNAGGLAGDDNVALGRSVLPVLTSGTQDIGAGTWSLENLTTGSYNAALGTSSFGSITSGNGNVGLGNYSGAYETGSYNTFLGFKAGYDATGGTANIVLGQNVDLPSATSSGQLNIGNLIYATGLYSGSSMSSSPVSGGYVGIGTTSPTSLLSVGSSSQFAVNSSGGVTATSVTFPGGTQNTPWTGVLCGGDYAEAVDPAGDLKAYEPGDVLVITDEAGRDGDVRKSAEPYSTLVAGIYATKPGVVGRRESLPKDVQDLPMAMVGIVPTKVTTVNGPIHRGDLLVTSSTPGYAMRGTDRNRLVGAVIGKAMGSLPSGTGVIEVLVTLQ